MKILVLDFRNAGWFYKNVSKYDEKEFVFDCSKTNARIIEASLGKDTKSWIGKQILLETYKTKTTEGKMTSAVNVVKTL